MHPDLAVAVVSNCSCSERRRAANRANAQKSTGPRTAEGKAAVAGNAVTHGLRAERVIVVAETKPSRRRAFEEFAEALRRELKPVGVMQSIVFDRIAILAWKLKTLPAVERRMLRDDRAERRKLYQERYERVGDAAEPIAPGELSETALVARWFHNGRGDAGNCYATLRRYEAGIERSFYRACAELKRLREDAAESEDAEPERAEAEPLAEPEHTERVQESAERVQEGAAPPESHSAEQSQDPEPAGEAQVPARDEVATEPVGRPLLADIDANASITSRGDVSIRARAASRPGVGDVPVERVARVE